MENEANKIRIGNMVCDRCVSAVSGILEHLEIKNASVEMGSVAMDRQLTFEEKIQLENELNKAGFVIVREHDAQLTEHIKNTVIQFVYNIHEHEKTNLSTYIQQQIKLEYNYLSTVFSSFEGTTIERYSIALKIERVKEMLEPGDKTLSQIAFEMGYSSAAHLSAQFKKITGFSPSRYKIMNPGHRKSIAGIL